MSLACEHMKTISERIKFCMDEEKKKITQMTAAACIRLHFLALCHLLYRIAAFPQSFILCPVKEPICYGEKGALWNQHWITLFAQSYKTLLLTGWCVWCLLCAGADALCVETPGGHLEWRFSDTLLYLQPLAHPGISNCEYGSVMLSTTDLLIVH